jgi:hypothetical protein
MSRRTFPWQATQTRYLPAELHPENVLNGWRTVNDTYWDFHDRNDPNHTIRDDMLAQNIRRDRRDEIVDDFNTLFSRATVRRRQRAEGRFPDLTPAEFRAAFDRYNWFMRMAPIVHWQNIPDETGLPFQAWDFIDDPNEDPEDFLERIRPPRRRTHDEFMTWYRANAPAA